MTHLFPYPPSHGTELRVLKLLQGLQAAGYRVVLVLTEEPHQKEALVELRKFVTAVHWLGPAWRTRLGRRFPRLRRIVWEKIKPWVAPFRRRARSEAGKSYQPIPSVVGVEAQKRGVVPPELASLVSKLARRYRPVGVIAVYIFLTDCFALLKPDVLKIVDTIDVFSLREKQVVRYGIEDDPWNATAQEERAYLLRADAILAIQEQEARALRDLVPERPVLTIGIDFEVDGKLARSSTESIAMVASGTPLNIHGFRTFLSECWPEIKSARPSACLKVVGSIANVCRVNDDSIEYVEWVDDLTETYRRARVVINPAMAGTGLKVKSVEALAYGKPLVAWPHGVDGLDYDGAPPYVKCESWKEFAAAVIRILHNDDEAEALGERALEYARANFGATKVYQPLVAYLGAHSTKAGFPAGQVAVVAHE